MLTLGLGKSGRCSCPETRTEPAREKIYIEFVGIVNQFSLSCALHSVSKLCRSYSGDNYPRLTPGSVNSPERLEQLIMM
jgi:hypothetical protein